MKKQFRCLVAMIAAVVCCGSGFGAAVNLMPNGDFSDKTDPLKGWRIAFPYHKQYLGNEKRCSVVTEGGRKCLRLDGTGKEGGTGVKAESPLTKTEPGAVYDVSLDMVVKGGFSKVFVQAWVAVPGKELKGVYEVRPADDQYPQMVPCQKHQISQGATHNGTDPMLKAIGKEKKQQPAPVGWQTLKTQLVVQTSEKTLIFGKPAKPEYMNVKVDAFAKEVLITNLQVVRVK